MIAATAIAEGLPLLPRRTPGDFTGLDTLIRVVPVTSPPVPHERPAGSHPGFATATTRLTVRRRVLAGNQRMPD